MGEWDKEQEKKCGFIHIGSFLNRLTGSNACIQNLLMLTELVCNNRATS